MIGYLKGLAVSSDTVVTANGIGWRLLPETALVEGEETVLWVSSQHSQNNGTRMFGFSTRRERDLFEMLCSAPKCGAKTAMALISELGPARLVEALKSSDIPVLTTVKGVGPAVASQMCPALATKLADVDAGVPDGTDPVLIAEVSAALRSMGFPTQQVETAVRVGDLPDTYEEMMTELIRRLGELL